MNKITIVIVVSFCSILTSCASSSVTTTSGETVSPPRESELLKAKVGLCKGVISDEDIARFAGNSSADSPQERREQKHKAIDDWRNTISELDQEYKGRQFTISLYANFKNQHTVNGEKLHQSFYQLKRPESDSGAESTALPLHILQNIHTNSNLASVHPPHLTKSDNFKESNNRSEMLTRYGNSPRANMDIYVFNKHTQYHRNGYDVGIAGSYGGIRKKGMSGDYLMGVNIEVPYWFNNPKSVIKHDRNGFYLDSTMFEFKKIYDAYPDLYTALVEITYIYRLTHCEGTNLMANVNEIIVTPITNSNVENLLQSNGILSHLIFN